jgi:general nucleoside transport system ATP-binding protein
MLSLNHVTKSYGATRAVDDVSLTIRQGEIVGLIGENGAGKTTLMRIVANEIAPDAGTITAPATGMVHQHFALVSHFTIAENLALVRDRRFRFVSRTALEREATTMIESSGIELPDVSRRAADLSVGERAKLELIKAVASHPELLILDEPTSVLTPLESADLFRLMRRLAAAGTAIVFITHKIPEVVEVAERLIVMRRGRVVADTRAKGMTAEQIAEVMVGTRPVDDRRSRLSGQAGLPVLQRQAGLPLLHRGEIVAVVGVAGNGQGELAERVRRTPDVRVGYIPEDRTRHALIGEMSIAENIALRSGRKDARARAERLIAEYRIKARGPDQLAGELSGGNQQKVVLARELDRKPDLLIASEPTRGLDIEATRFVHDQLRAAAGGGAAVLLITSDLDEAFALADGIHVVYRGTLSSRMTGEEASGRVAALMAGLA